MNNHQSTITALIMTEKPPTASLGFQFNAIGALRHPSNEGTVRIEKPN